MNHNASACLMEDRAERRPRQYPASAGFHDQDNGLHAAAKDFMLMTGGEIPMSAGNPAQGSPALRGAWAFAPSSSCRVSRPACRPRAFPHQSDIEPAIVILLERRIFSADAWRTWRRTARECRRRGGLESLRTRRRRKAFPDAPPPGKNRKNRSAPSVWKPARSPSSR